MNQRDFLHSSHSGHWAELCVALYERELQQLSRETAQTPFIQRRLGSLSHYVRRAAQALLDASVQSDVPLALDIQNASWQGRQAPAAPSASDKTEALQHWLERYARLGLVLPVEFEQHGLQRVELDSIDRVDNSTQRVHLNRFGWFNYAGVALDEQTGGSAQLLKPGKVTMSAACCGFQWSATGRTAPRTLSLREVLLSASLVWPRFTQVKRLPG